MATEKNITMKQFNGTDYDTLYPKTKVEQVEGAYTQQQILSDSTKVLYSLGSDAVPDDVFSIIHKNLPFKLLSSFKVAGSYTFTVPEGITKLGVYLVGGGGSGGAVTSTDTKHRTIAGGGASGFAKSIILPVAPGETYNLVVGTGGEAVTNTSGSRHNGKNGGTTSFGEHTVAGGGGGGSLRSVTINSNSIYVSVGGQNGTSSIDVDHTMVLYGGNPEYPRRQYQNAFDPTMITLAAGANACDGIVGITERMPDGTGGGTRGALNATGNGNGGAGNANYNTLNVVTSGAGSPGMVLVYGSGG